MDTKLVYVFNKTIFNLEETLCIEFTNPPYIPESKQSIDIDFHSFFADDIANKIGSALENDKRLLPSKTMETWNKAGVEIVYEYMNPAKIKYKAS